MDLQINKAGTKMVAICTGKQIHVYDLIKKEKETCVNHLWTSCYFELLFTSQLPFAQAGQ
jgi:hypothetical protein